MFRQPCVWRVPAAAARAPSSRNKQPVAHTNPVSEPTRRPKHRKPAIPLLLGWTALSLDAPFVCVGWFWLLAFGTGIRPTLPATVSLFLSVWLAYLADRWFDSWRLKQPEQGAHRHRFVHRYRAVLGLIWTLVLILAVGQAIVSLDRDTLNRGFILLAFLLAYFAAIHLGPRKLRDLVPRELVTALVLVSGILIFLPTRSVPLAFSGALAALFAANCMLIAQWETASDRAQEVSSLVQRRPGVAEWTRILLLSLVAAGIAAPFLTVGTGPALAWTAISLAAMLLIILKNVGRRWSPDTLRPLADLALMTPWLIIGFHAIQRAG